MDKLKYFMKTSLIIGLISLSTASYSQVQLEKGSFNLGGTLGMSAEKIKYDMAASNLSYNDEKRYNLNLNPGLSYFIFNNLSAGILFPINYFKTTYSDSEILFKEMIYSIGPVVRYYFPLGQWAIFSQLNVSIGDYTIEAIQMDPYRDEYFETKIEGNLISYSGGLGTTYFVSKSLGIETIFYYKYESTKFEEYVIKKREDSSLNFNVGYNFSLINKGAGFFFRKGDGMTNLILTII